jgi:IS30 family transposase
MSKHKHLTNSERQQIEHWLSERVSIKKIATYLGKSTSTITREIVKRAVVSNKKALYRIPNRCKHQGNCTKRYLCENNPDCTKLCKLCKFCNQLCADFEEDICQKLFSPPYVCNGCSDEYRCVLRKKYYSHRHAHKDYREILVESRTGVNISEDELLKIDGFLSPLIKKGQSIHHIVVNNPDEFTISEKSLYRYIAGGLFKARNIDMPRDLRLKPRNRKPFEHKVDSKCRIGRTYDDFNSFLQQHTDVSIVEMDTVMGRVGGKVLLTLLFKSCDLMLAFIRDRNTSQSVIDVFGWLYSVLGHKTFCILFYVILTDNGSEFSNPKALEFDSESYRRTHIFYCDPRASFQKPNVELNHEFIRKILPKGSSFDNLTQDNINLVMSHINSYSRAKLNDKSPFDVFSFLYGEGILEKLGLRRIPSNEIILKPQLLRN